MPGYVNFNFTTFITRGPYDREIEVDVTYSFNGKIWSLLAANDLTDGSYLTEYEIDVIETEIADRCDDDYDEYMLGEE